jgi:catechol 2,3-dioxygenase-like lactoylglutathione lyase family enzyme
VLLNHLDLPVSDVPAVAAFLVDHFDLVPVSRIDSPAIAILDDGHGFTLVLQRRKQPEEVFPSGLHIGFIKSDPAEVIAHRARLAAAGLSVSEVETNARGVQCYCRGPSELLVEVSCRSRSMQELVTRATTSTP